MNSSKVYSAWASGFLGNGKRALLGCLTSWKDIMVGRAQFIGVISTFHNLGRNASLNYTVKYQDVPSDLFNASMFLI